MRRTGRLAPALALALSAGTAAAAPPARPAPAVLVVENAERGRTLALEIPPGEPFSVTYHHSMYDAPVTERFCVAADGRIVLTEVSSPSAAVREYFGLTAAGERHALERPMEEIVFRVAAGAPQRLELGGVERSFLELGDHGDRVVMRAARRPPASPRPEPSR